VDYREEGDPKIQGSKGGEKIKPENRGMPGKTEREKVKESGEA